MRKTISISFDVEVLDAASTKAFYSGISLTTYVETVLRRDLDMETDEPIPNYIDYEVVRNEFTLVREEGESDADYAERSKEMSEFIESSRVFDPDFEG